MLSDKPFTKENLDQYLKELAKEYRKRSGKNTPAEIILIGGASVVINYGFREMTYDADAIITASSYMRILRKVSDLGAVIIEKDTLMTVFFFYFITDLFLSSLRSNPLHFFLSAL